MASSHGRLTLTGAVLPLAIFLPVVIRRAAVCCCRSGGAGARCDARDLARRASSITANSAASLSLPGCVGVARVFCVAGGIWRCADRPAPPCRRRSPWRAARLRGRAAITWNILASPTSRRDHLGMITSPGRFQLIVPNVRALAPRLSGCADPCFRRTSSILLHGVSLRQLIRRSASMISSDLDLRKDNSRRMEGQPMRAKRPQPRICLTVTTTNGVSP